MKRETKRFFLLCTTLYMGLIATTLQAQKFAPLTPVAVPTFSDLSGKRFGLTTVASKKATVFFYGSSQCPISNIYTPRLVELSNRYEKQGVQFFFVDANKEDSPALLRSYTTARHITFPAIKDDGLVLADTLHATHTPQVIVLDSSAIVRYRGRIDDNQDRTKVIRNELKDALDALLAGEKVKISRTLPFGCEIFRGTVKTTSLATNITYSQHVAQILYKNCVGCHRPGESGPFSLETYQQAKTWGKAIKAYTTRRQMPPWKAAPGIGDFKDARIMSDTEIATVTKWVDSGMPAGDLKRCPKVPEPPSTGFKLGKPDQIICSPTPYRLGAEGTDVYRNFVVPVDTNEDRFIKGLEFQADNRAVVHHIIVFFDLSGKSVDLDNADPEPGYSSNDLAIGVPFDKTVWVAGWAPGNSPRLLPKGTAFFLPKGTKVVLQVHYHKNGQEQYDRSRVGLYFDEEKNIQKIVQTGEVANPFLNIKPGLANQQFRSTRALSSDTEIIAVMPHMHMLGRQMKLTAQTPDGKEVPLIHINDWDFNWQETYVFKQPLQFPKSTLLKLVAEYDNTESNPRQPSHPPKSVFFGEATTDEMCIGFFQFTRPYIKGVSTPGSLVD